MFNEVRWSVSTYASYLKTMFGWADELGLTADELEASIFSTQARPGNTQWLSDDHERSEVGSRRTWITGLCGAP